MCPDSSPFIKLVLTLSLTIALGLVAYEFFRLRNLIRDKEDLIRHLGEDLALWRRRAIAAEGMIHDQSFTGSAP